MFKREGEEDCGNAKVRKEDNFKMSKREEVCEDMKMKEEENYSDNSPTSRKQMYDAVFQELRISKEANRMARYKIEQLQNNEEDFYCMEALSYTDEANKKMQEGMDSLKDGNMKEEDNCLPGRSDDPASSRNLMYDEAFKEFKRSQEASRMAKHKIEQLSHNVKDSRCKEVLSYIDEANSHMEEAINSLKESSKHWVSFLAIPEVPMRHILKYLNFKDKANFRMSSQNHRDIIDDCDDDFKIVNIDHKCLMPNHEIFLTSKNIKLKCYQFSCKHPPNISDRLVALDISSPDLDFIPSTCEIEKIKLYGRYIIQSLSIGNFASSLKVLELACVDLTGQNLDGLSLPNLESLELTEVTGFDCVVQLLASCCTSLQRFSLLCINLGLEHDEEEDEDEDDEDDDEEDDPEDEEWDFRCLIESGIKMTRLKEIKIKYSNVTGISDLLESASNSLKAVGIVGFEELTPTILMEPDYSFPNLESIKFDQCHDDCLSILACSTPRLTNVSLRDITCNSYPEYFEVNPVTRITNLKMVKFEVAETCQKVLAAAAGSVQQMELRELDLLLEEFTKTFPKLERLRTGDCKAPLISEIVRRSPCLKDLNVDNYDDQLTHVVPGCVDRRGVEKFTIRKCTRTSWADWHEEDEIESLDHFEENGMFSKMADTLVDLSIIGLNLPTLEVQQLKLTKLSLCHTSCTQGICELLKACESTLEELNITESAKEPFTLQGLQSLKVLKKLTIHFFEDERYLRVIRMDGWFEFGSITEEELEMRDFPYHHNRTKEFGKRHFDWLNNHLLTLDLNLPNLKILHIYPRPADSVVKQISRQLPENVTLWFFLPHRF